MNTTTVSLPRAALVFLSIVLVLIGIGVCFGAYRYYKLTESFKSSESNLASTTLAMQQVDDAYANEEAKNAQLSAKLGEAQDTNSAYDAQVSQLSSTVGTLSKLETIDPELLSKYSKVYFLNENYVPAKLSDIPANYSFPGKTLQFESDALPFLAKMISDAQLASTSLEAISAYRSFGTQSALKSAYKVTYGTTAANSFSADQGYSEHQLGTALDFTTTQLGANFSNGFEKTDGYTWLTMNAWKYGFILSYPKGNAYYIYEPWHWRFVGVKLATMLHAEGENFYEVDQRTINQYLISLFDPIAP